MQHERKYVTSAEYARTVIPGPGLVLIEKDGISENYGELILTKNTVKQTLAHAATALIVSVSPFKCENEHDNYLCNIYRPGDRIGVDSTTPRLSPAPPYWIFKNPDDSADGHYFIHIADILGIICETEEQYREFLTRIDHWHMNNNLKELKNA